MGDRSPNQSPFDPAESGLSGGPKAASAVEPLRVLHLIESQERRGAELFARWLTEQLSSSIFQNAICSLYSTGSSTDPSDVPMYQLDVASGSLERYIGWDARVLLRLRRVLRHYRPVLIVGHGARTLKYIVMARLLLPQVRTIYRNISVASFWAGPWPKVMFRRLLLRWVDFVVSTSDVCRQDFIQLYSVPSEKTETIYTGVNVEPYRRSGAASVALRRSLGFNRDTMVLITVGSLSPEKGHADLFPMLADLRRGGLPAHLLVVGEGPLRGTLATQANGEGVGEAVHFLGHRRDVPQLLGAADLFVLPSRSEGMGAVLIEAGLAGLATVAYSVGGVLEVIQDQVTGLLVPPLDRRRLGEAVLSLLRDSQRRSAIAEAARQYCMEQFNLEEIAQQYEKVFLRVLSSKRPALLASRP